MATYCFQVERRKNNLVPGAIIENAVYGAELDNVALTD